MSDKIWEVFFQVDVNRLKHEILTFFLYYVSVFRGRIQRKTWCTGPHAGVDKNLTLCPLQSRLQHIYHGQPYARVDLNPMPQSILSPSQGLWIWPLDILDILIVFHKTFAIIGLDLNPDSLYSKNVPNGESDRIWIQKFG